MNHVGVEQIYVGLTISADHATEEPDCIYGSLGNDDPAPYVPKKYLVWRVRWSNHVSNGSTYCKSRRRAEISARRNPRATIERFP